MSHSIQITNSTIDMTGIAPFSYKSTKITISKDRKNKTTHTATKRSKYEPTPQSFVQAKQMTRYLELEKDIDRKRENPPNEFENFYYKNQYFKECIDEYKKIILLTLDAKDFNSVGRIYEKIAFIKLQKLEQPCEAILTLIKAIEFYDCENDIQRLEKFIPQLYETILSLKQSLDQKIDNIQPPPTDVYAGNDPVLWNNDIIREYEKIASVADKLKDFPTAAQAIEKIAIIEKVRRQNPLKEFQALITAKGFYVDAGWLESAKRIENLIYSRYSAFLKRAEQIKEIIEQNPPEKVNYSLFINEYREIISYALLLKDYQTAADIKSEIITIKRKYENKKVTSAFLIELLNIYSFIPNNEKKISEIQDQILASYDQEDAVGCSSAQSYMDKAAFCEEQNIFPVVCQNSYKKAGEIFLREKRFLLAGLCFDKCLECKDLAKQAYREELDQINDWLEHNYDAYYLLVERFHEESCDSKEELKDKLEQSFLTFYNIYPQQQIAKFLALKLNDKDKLAEICDTQMQFLTHLNAFLFDGYEKLNQDHNELDLFARSEYEDSFDSFSFDEITFLSGRITYDLLQINANVNRKLLPEKACGYLGDVELVKQKIKGYRYILPSKLYFPNVIENFDALYHHDEKLSVYKVLDLLFKTGFFFGRAYENY